MKEVFTLIAGLFLINITTIAQFDDRFYYPKKKWIPIADSVNYSEYNFTIYEDTLNGILLPTEKENRGSVFFLHGSGGNISTYLPMTIPLVKHGFNVFMIDMPGYGKSSGTPTHLGIEKVVPIAFDKTLELESFKSKPIIVYGASMGTQAAAVLARDRKEQFELLILDGGMSSFTDIAVATAPEEQKSMIAQFLISPYSSKEIVKDTEGLEKWIIHSKEDSGVPYEQGLEVFENASEPKHLWTYQGEHLEAIQKKEEEFFKRLENIIKGMK